MARTSTFSGPVEPSLLRAVAVAHGVAIEEAEGDGRYEVMLLDSKSDDTASFVTDAFIGGGRVDLEDACELGGFDGLVVGRRRGRFSPAEGARRLREIVDDLTFDHANQFWLLAADREHLGAQLHTDFDALSPRAFRRRLLAVLALCGFDPVVESESSRWLVLRVGPKGARGRLLVPRGRGMPVLPDRLRPGETLVLLRPADHTRQPLAGGLRFVPIAELLRQLHLARIETLRLELTPASAPRARAGAGAAACSPPRPTVQRARRAPRK